MMKLYYKGKLLGTINGEILESSGWTGKIKLNKKGEGLIEFWRYMTNDDISLAEDPPFDDELEDSNWEMAIGGDRVPIFVPAVHLPDTIIWRCRTIAPGRFMKLRFKGKAIASIKFAFFETPEFHGTIVFNRDRGRHANFIKFGSGYESLSRDAPFDSELQDWKNWEIADGKTRIEVGHMTFRPPDQIIWRGWVKPRKRGK